MQGGPYRAPGDTALELEQTRQGGEYVAPRQRGTFCCWRDDETPVWMTQPIRRDGTAKWLTPAVLLWGLNAFAFVFHTALTFTVLGLSVGLDNWKTHGGVLLPVYKTRLEFTRTNASDNSGAPASSVRIDFLPTYERQEGGINLTVLTILFFALSAFFHLVVVATAWRWSLYYWWIDECRNPMRWIEYAFSASIMTVIIAFFGGVRSDHLLLCLFALSFSTMCFGWVTEALSRPDPTSRRVASTSPSTSSAGDSYYPEGSENARIATTRHTRWAVDGARHRERLVWGCAPWTAWTAPFQRLGPHFLGYAPYIVLWYVIIDTFVYNTNNLPEGEGPPDYVWLIVVGQMAIFSSFAVVQLLQQSTHYGCERYWWGEALYVILSVASKGMLGGALLANILMLSGTETVDDAIAPVAARA